MRSLALSDPAYVASITGSPYADGVLLGGATTTCPTIGNSPSSEPTMPWLDVDIPIEFSGGISVPGWFQRAGNAMSVLQDGVYRFATLGNCSVVLTSVPWNNRGRASYIRLFKNGGRISNSYATSLAYFGASIGANSAIGTQYQGEFTNIGPSFELKAGDILTFSAHHQDDGSEEMYVSGVAIVIAKQ